MIETGLQKKVVIVTGAPASAGAEDLPAARPA
jgi:hypothetical protein